jgi:uncharacterized membrane protein
MTPFSFLLCQNVLNADKMESSNVSSVLTHIVKLVLKVFVLVGILCPLTLSHTLNLQLKVKYH